MKKSALLLAALLSIVYVSAQNNLKFIIKDGENKSPLAGASVTIKNIHTTITNASGIVEFTNVPDGKQEITFSFSGYAERTEIFVLPQIIFCEANKTSFILSTCPWISSPFCL